MGANTVFYSLDIKHLQLDSLGYIHCGQLAATGLFSLCAIHYETTLKFFSSSYKDVSFQDVNYFDSMLIILFRALII